MGSKSRIAGGASPTDTQEQPWREHGPVALESVNVKDIDNADTEFQFRFSSDWKKLQASLEQNGQLNPIKLIAGEGCFRIVDGHSRFRAIKNLGWEKVTAMLYKGMSDREAKILSYEANVTRRNLSFAEKATAMQDAVNDGLEREAIARLFGVSRRTVERYLELPDDLRRHIDCQAVTMAHGRVLKPLVGSVSPDAIGDLVAWIMETSASEKELRKKLKQDGLVDRRGKKKAFGIVTSGTVFSYRFKIGPKSSHDDRQEVLDFFRRAIVEIEMMGLGPCADEE